MIEINPKYVEWMKKRFERELNISLNPLPDPKGKKVQNYLNLGNNNVRKKL